MGNMFFLLALLGVLVAPGFAHPGHKADDRVDCSDYPPVMSYHVHITYMLTNEDQIKEAGALREQALVAFKDLLGENPVCQGTEEDPSGRYGDYCFLYIQATNSSYFVIRR